MTDSGRRKKGAFDPRQYRDKLPTNAELADLRDTGTLEDLLLFRKEHAAALSAEKSGRRSLGRNDARQRAKRQADDKNPASLPEPDVDQAESSVPVSSSMLVSLLFQKPTLIPTTPVKPKPVSAPKAKKPHVSRAAGGPSLKSDVLKSLRTRTWFHSLLVSADPDVALHYEKKHQDALDVRRLASGQAAHLVRHHVPLDVPTILPSPSSLLEDCYAQARAGKGDLTPLNLHARDYLNGANHPTRHTVELFDTVFPGCAEVYSAGPHGLPVWEVLDGQEKALQSFLLTEFPKGHPSPDAWAQAILDSLLEPAFRFEVAPYVTANIFYRFNIALREAVSKSIKARYAEMGQSVFMRESGIYPKAVFLLIAAQLSFGANKLLSTRSLQWLIQVFSQMGFYRKFFGVFVDDYVVDEFIQGGPVNKL